MANVRLIDANALLNHNEWTVKQYSEEEADAWRDGVALMKEKIKCAPTVTQKEFKKEGHWEVFREEDNSYSSFVCSNCREMVDEDYFYIPMEKGVIGISRYRPFRYCPFCGAKLEIDNNA